MILQRLVGNNLSEEMTGNDEILLTVFLLYPDTTSQTEKWDAKAVLAISPIEFSERGQSEILNDTLMLANNLPNEAAYVFTLVELDEFGSAPQVRQRLAKELGKGHFLKKVEGNVWNSLLADDDFLGLQFYSIDQLQELKHWNILFQGRHLFDRFDYKLVVQSD
ncbi:MAG: hypothetical protein AAGD05_09375 [Bacteroidota bacterium]